MSQQAYTINSGNGIAGLKVDIGFDRVESYIAQQIISFGRAVGAEAGAINKVHQPVKDIAVMLFDGDFIIANVITITVNNVATAAIPFNTDHDTTAADVLAAIQGLSTVSSASISDPGVNREFTVESEGITISMSETITSGASQVTGAVTLSSDDIFRGISVHTHKDATEPISGNVGYKINDAVSVMTQGVIWVETSVAVIKDEIGYVDMTGGIGKLTNISSGNLATGGKFKSTNTVAGLVQFELNLP